MNAQRLSTIASTALGLAMLSLVASSAAWLRLPGIPSPSQLIQIQDREKAHVLFLSGEISRHKPDMANGGECAMCRSAPGSAAQSVGEKTKAILPNAWHTQLHFPLETFIRLRLSLVQVTLPVRIAFCRWLN